MLEDIAVVRRGYDAFNAGDLAALNELIAEDAVWHTPGHGVLAGDSVGRVAIIARLGRSTVESEGTFEVRLKRVLTDEDGRLIGIHHTVAKRRGRLLDAYGCIVFELGEGRILDAREHLLDLAAWDAFWS